MDTFLELANGVLQSEAFFGLLMAVIGIVATWAAATYASWKKKSGNKEEIETIEKWAKDKIKDTYIKLGEENKKCEFKRNWKKEKSK